LIAAGNEIHDLLFGHNNEKHGLHLTAVLFLAPSTKRLHASKPCKLAPDHPRHTRDPLAEPSRHQDRTDEENPFRRKIAPSVYREGRISLFNVHLPPQAYVTLGEKFSCSYPSTYLDAANLLDIVPHPIVVIGHTHHDPCLPRT
jgi:hypothetical protein